MEIKANGVKSLKRKAFCFGACLLCLLAVFGCSPKPIEGVYVFKSKDVEETLDLQPGGEFRQRIKMDDQIFNATGRWSLVARDLKFRGEFLVRFDTSKGKLLKPPEQYSMYSAYWDARNNRISFSADYDAEFFVKRAP
jgi:hypothetical protein